MKKILLFLIGVVYTLGANAQAFTVSSDTVKGLYTSGPLELHDNITNPNTSDVTISWNVITSSTNFPASWSTSAALGICDANICRQNDNGGQLTNGTSFSCVYSASATNDFHVVLDLSGGVTGTYYLTVSLRSGATQKNIVFMVSKFAASVANTVKSDDGVLLFPNPARNNLNVTYSASSGIKSVAIYNLIGKMVASYKVASGSAQIDIDNIPAGVYYLRLMGEQGNVITTRRFTHQ